MRSRSACFDSLTFIAQFGFGGSQYFLGRAVADSAPAALVDSSLQTFQLLAFVLVAAYRTASYRRDRADAAGRPPTMHRRARAHGLAEGVGAQLARSGGG
jgi:hypothetical protein